MRCGVTNRRLQAIQIDWLNQIVDKASLAALLQIIVHPKTAERDAGDGLSLTNLSQQIEPTAVGQSDIA